MYLPLVVSFLYTAVAEFTTNFALEPGKQR